MSKRKPMDKAQARDQRNRLLDTAAAAELSLIEGVREMRAIAGMTQEEFAKHRGVSARVIKAIELGQGNPTVATLNQIGQFFGLEVAFVPIQRKPASAEQAVAAATAQPGLPQTPDLVIVKEDAAHRVTAQEIQLKSSADIIRDIEEAREDIWRRISAALEALENVYKPSTGKLAPEQTPAALVAKRPATKKKPRSK